jgi:hypothetical protein
MLLEQNYHVRFYILVVVVGVLFKFEENAEGH